MSIPLNTLVPHLCMWILNRLRTIWMSLYIFYRDAYAYVRLPRRHVSRGREGLLASRQPADAPAYKRLHRQARRRVHTVHRETFLMKNTRNITSANPLGDPEIETFPCLSPAGFLHLDMIISSPSWANITIITAVSIPMEFPGMMLNISGII